MDKKREVQNDRIISVNYYSHFNRPPVSKGEKSCGQSRTTTLGYIDQAVLVEQMLKAGETLTLIRMLGQGRNYDATADTDPNSMNIPISRMRDFDLIDLHKLQQNVYDKMRELYQESLKNNDAVGEAQQIKKVEQDPPPAVTPQEVSKPLPSDA